MSADGADKPGEILRSLTSPAVTEIERAQERLQALATRPAANISELNRVNAASRTTLGSFVDPGAGLASAIRSATNLGGLDRLDAARTISANFADMSTRFKCALDFSGIAEAQERIGKISREFEEARARERELLDKITRTLDTFRCTMASDIAALGTSDPSRILDDGFDRLAHPPLPPVNPIYRNANLEQMVTMQLDFAKVHQILNDTTFAFSLGIQRCGKENIQANLVHHHRGCFDTAYDCVGHVAKHQEQRQSNQSKPANAGEASRSHRHDGGAIRC